MVSNLAARFCISPINTEFRRFSLTRVQLNQTNRLDLTQNQLASIVGDKGLLNNAGNAAIGFKLSGSQSKSRTLIRATIRFRCKQNKFNSENVLPPNKSVDSCSIK